MNDSPTGQALGQDTYDAQVAAGLAFIQSLNGALPNAEQSAALAVLMAKIAGNATITHVPGFVQITFDPTAGSHDDPEKPGTAFNRPIPAVAQQVNEESTVVAIWWKNGTASTAWIKLWPVAPSSTISLSTELPLEDGIADPGDTSSGQATAKRHVHPDKDTVGGDLYFIDSVAAVPIVNYATDILGVPYYRMGIAPVGAWDLHQLLTFGGHGVIGG